MAFGRPMRVGPDWPSAHRPSIGLFLGGLLCVLMIGSTAVAAEVTLESGEVEEGIAPTNRYRFLMKQAELMFEFGKLREASHALEEACNLPAGRDLFDCWRRLATVSESSGRIGVAIEAWSVASAFGGREREVATTELKRLQSIYGRVAIVLGASQNLPTRPFELGFEGLLIDPALKLYVASVQRELSERGLSEQELWLPAGTFRALDSEVVVVAGVSIDWVLPSSLLLSRPKAFRLGARGDLAPVGGPWSVGIALEGGLGGVLDSGFGRGPGAFALRVGLGRRLGPIRLETAIRIGLSHTEANLDGTLRQPAEALAPSMQILGSIDLGLDFAFGPRFFGSPYVAAVGGSLGQALVDCLAENPSGKVVYRGSCRLPTLGAGARAGLKLWWLLGENGRWALELGAFGEALAGQLRAHLGDELSAGDPVLLLDLERFQFVWLRAGVDVGVLLRF